MSHGFEGDGSNDMLARMLDISVEDVENYVTLDTNESDEGQLYSYVAIFDRSTPQHVLEAAGAEGSYSVQLSVNIFDEEERD